MLGLMAFLKLLAARQPAKKDQMTNGHMRQPECCEERASKGQKTTAGVRQQQHWHERKHCWVAL
jgi:hypothetical protein